MILGYAILAISIIGLLLCVLFLPQETSTIHEETKEQVYPVRGYTKGLLSFVDGELCDYFFEEMSDGTMRVKKLGCIKADAELIRTLTERFLGEQLD